VNVWVFAGGGESEVSGFFPFLRSTFPNCQFQLCTPIKKKPGGKPRLGIVSQGFTGKSLLEQIKTRLQEKLKLKHTCDLILVFDDLDYDSADQKRQEFESALNQIWQKYPGLSPVKQIIGFAKPELESWVIADWDKTVGRDPEFRKKHKAMQHWLVSDQQVSFSSPEDFGLNPAISQCYHKKLSNAIIQASEQSEGTSYSKQLHTARFIKNLDPAIAQQKCPEFRKFFTSLSQALNLTSF
jgi:Domain of unknown function (DUF4276)